MKLVCQRDICTPKFFEALIHISQNKWIQPKFPSADEWIREMRYRYTMEYYSTIKKNEILPFLTAWMDLKINMLSEIKASLEKQVLHDLTHMWKIK
jgi:hypothetical protein